jgi:hypothetical protein
MSAPFNMMRLVQVLVLLLAMVQYTVALATLTGEHIVMIEFNEGRNGDNDPNMTCTEDELYQVQEAMTEAIERGMQYWPISQYGQHDRRKLLRAVAGAASASDSDRHYRSLRASTCQTRWCGKNCLFRGNGCPDPTSRRLMEDRREQGTTSTPCDEDLHSIRNGLELYATYMLPERCRNLIMAPRRETCHPAVECGIDHVNVWNAMNNSMVIENFPTSGGTLCARDRQTFSAETNYEPQNVTFTLTGGPATRPPIRYVNVERTAPFFLHPKRGQYDIRGADLLAGNYTLRIVGDDDTKPKIVNFTVTNQC